MMASSAEWNDLIQIAIQEIGVPPALRARAESNMHRLIATEGPSALEKRIRDARLAREKVTKYLNKTAEALVRPDVTDVNDSFWTLVASQVDSRQDSEWAREFRRVSSAIRKVEHIDIFQNRDLGRKVCEHFSKIANDDGLKLENPVLKAGILTCVANTHSAYAKRYNDYTYMETSLIFYREAFDLVRKVNYKPILPMLQANRANAVISYVHLLQLRFLDKFREDVNDIISYCDGFRDEPESRLLYSELFSGDIRESLAEMSQFFHGEGARKRDAIFATPPSDRAMHYDIDY